MQHVTGPTLPSFLLLKYSLLTATFGFLYLVAKRIIRYGRRSPACAADALPGGVEYARRRDQTVMLMCMVAASTWCFMRLAERGMTGS